MPRHCFKVLCPEPLASSILGTKGSTKDRIQDECNCRLVMSNRDDFYPNTRLRLVVVQAEAQEEVLKALDKILDLLLQCADAERSNPGRTAVQGEPDFLGKEPEELVLRVAVPIKVGSAIIGPKGAHVQKLKEECSAKVIIDNDHRGGHQACRVAARYDGIRLAVSRISDRLAEDLHARPQEFEAWSNVRSFEREAESYGKGRGRSRSRDRGRPGGMEVLQAAVGQLGSAVDFEYEITCELPPEKVSAMIGPGGQIVKNVRQSTSTNIHFDEVPPGAREQTMHIKGPLLGIYRAHVMMMRRYHEHDVEQFAPKGGSRPGKAEAKGFEKGYDSYSKGDYKGDHRAYDSRGYEGRGFDRGSKGSDKGPDRGYARGYDAKSYDAKGYDAKGYDAKGYDAKSKDYAKGYPAKGYGYDRQEKGGKGYDKGMHGLPKGYDRGYDGKGDRTFARGKDGRRDGRESREDLEGMLASLERQLNEVKDKLGR